MADKKKRRKRKKKAVKIETEPSKKVKVVIKSGREIEKFETDSIVMALVKTGLSQLRGVEKRGSVKNLHSLHRDIRIYEYILKGTPEEQEAKARKYADTKHGIGKGAPMRSNALLKALGWKI